MPGFFFCCLPRPSGSGWLLGARLSSRIHVFAFAFGRATLSCGLSAGLAVIDASVATSTLALDVSATEVLLSIVTVDGVSFFFSLSASFALMTSAARSDAALPTSVALDGLSFLVAFVLAFTAFFVAVFVFFSDLASSMAWFDCPRSSSFSLMRAAETARFFALGTRTRFLFVGDFFDSFLFWLRLLSRRLSQLLSDTAS